MNSPSPRSDASIVSRTESRQRPTQAAISVPRKAPKQKITSTVTTRSVFSQSPWATATPKRVVFPDMNDMKSCENSRKPIESVAPARKARTIAKGMRLAALAGKALSGASPGAVFSFTMQGLESSWVAPASPAGRRSSSGRRRERRLLRDEPGRGSTAAGGQGDLPHLAVRSGD